MGNSTIFDNITVTDPDTFLLERYKYILEQKRDGNKLTFKVAAIFQAIFVPIVAAQMFVVKAYFNNEIPLRLAKTGSVLLFLLTVFVCIICSTLILGGVASWLKYRRDEADVENAVFGMRRPSPAISNVFRWYETYIIISMICIEIAYAIALPNLIVPMLVK